MAALVWLLMFYSVLTVTLLTVTEGIPAILGMMYCALVVLALASHAKTQLYGSRIVPREAVPCEVNDRPTIPTACADSVKRTNRLPLIIVVSAIDVLVKWIITVRG